MNRLLQPQRLIRLRLARPLVVEALLALALLALALPLPMQAQPLISEATLAPQAQAAARPVQLRFVVLAIASLENLAFQAQVAVHFLIAKVRQGLVLDHQ